MRSSVMSIRTITRSACALSATTLLALEAASCGNGSDDGSADTAQGGDSAASDGGGSNQEPADGASDGGGASDSGASSDEASDGSSSASSDSSTPSDDSSSKGSSGKGSSGKGSSDKGSSDDDSSVASKGAGSGTASGKADGGGSNDTVSDCTASNLDISVSQGDPAAGSVMYTISFTNTGDDPCRIGGYPGVSAVGGGNGTQLGKAAQRGQAGKAAVLIPNGHAEASLKAVDVGDGGGPLGDECKATDADGWRIYAPGSKKAAYVEQDGLHGCAGDVDWLTVDGVHGMK
ncbi:DUF4232 domain-containing protein [Brachybacterium halotolerans subsp. kimchii]|uniref:DUF4232 domain-containing protein n=1 Tax=Brachybacterium halotolerans TaxID=2795215 RepID=UPI001E57720C|nr:DUF4232 domain-containing protein [Brachybacterium halotolerans]UEJ81517.1 DUF4232 domain-containing protein [Brachybacterium halotolerans subsp. kimchii]